MTATRSHPNPALEGWHFAGAPEPTLWYRFCRGGCRGLLPGFFRTRVFGRHHEPADGPVVYISNHQSFLDPMLVGFGLQRPLHYMARDTLFRAPGFKQLIASVNAFPVRRGAADTGAMKEGLRRLKAGHQLLIFAEGTRTRDGRIAPLLPGVAFLAQRSRATVVPVVIDGAYEAWPRTQPLPSPGLVSVEFGQPMAPDAVRALDAQTLVDRVREQMIAIQHDLRRRTGREPLNYED